MRGAMYPLFMVVGGALILNGSSVAGFHLANGTATLAQAAFAASDPVTTTQILIGNCQTAANVANQFLQPAVLSAFFGGVVAVVGALGTALTLRQQNPPLARSTDVPIIPTQAPATKPPVQ